MTLLLFAGLQVSCASESGLQLGVVFSDNFNRANNTNMGSNWTELTGAANFEIVSNELFPNSDFGTAFYGTTVEGSDITVQVDYRISGATATDLQTYLCARNLSSSERQNAYICGVQSGSLFIYELNPTDGDGTLLTGSAVTATDGTNITLTFQVSGSTPTCSISGDVTATDSSHSSGQYFGVSGTTTNNTLFFDDFSITRN